MTAQCLNRYKPLKDTVWEKRMTEEKFPLGSHLLSPLLWRALELSSLVIFGIEQVNVIGGVADQHLLTVLAVAERGHSARLVGQVSGNKPNTHARGSPAHVIT